MGNGKSSEDEDVEASPEAMAVLRERYTRMKNLSIPEIVTEKLDFVLDVQAEPAWGEVEKTYEFGRLLGEGMSSKVLKCCLKKDPEQKFAVKIIRKNMETAKLKSYFTTELSVMRNIEHPNTIRYYESYQDKDNYYHILEYCNGGILSKLFQEKKNVGNMGLIREVFFQAASAVYYLHAHGVCHRDIKLDNFLIKKKGKRGIKLTDFGFAKSYRKKRMKTVLGTRDYMSPEIYVDKEYGPECDCWSLGIMLYIMLFGCHPFPSESKLEQLTMMKFHQLEIPATFEASHPSVVEVLKGLLQFEPSNRMSLVTVLTSDFLQPTYLTINKHGLEILTQDLLITLLVFEHKMRFQKVLRNLYVKLFLDDEEIEGLTTVFRMIDFSEEGEITLSELKYFMSNLMGRQVPFSALKEVFQKINLDGGTTLTYLEFLTASASREFFKKPVYRKTVFDRLDLKSQGYLTEETLKVCFQRLGFNITQEELHDGFKQYDFYKDGKMTFMCFNEMFDKLDPRIEEEQQSFSDMYNKLREHVMNIS